jgi:hypothetical protein
MHGFEEQTDKDTFDLWDHLLEQQRLLPVKAFRKKEISAGFNVSTAALLSDKVIREIVCPWPFLLDSMRLYWSNGICSWEVNALHALWKETNIGSLEAFWALDWKTTMGQSNTRSWRLSLGHQSNFAGNSYRGSASNLQCFLPLFQYFLDGCMATRDMLMLPLQSLRALRRITIEMRKMIRAQQFNIDNPID